MSPPVRAVVFDLDGTLIDSVPDIAAALNRCLVARGRAVLDEESVTRLVGGGARELVARALGPGTPPAEIDAALADFLAGYSAEPVTLTRLYPGAIELLEALRQAGVPLAICTNKPQDLTMLILGRLSLAHYFTVVWGGEPGKPLKPDAACLRSVCEAFGGAPAETVMVGDSLTDVDAARAAGCPVIVVAHGYERRPPDSLGADAVCAGLAETAGEISRRLVRDRSRLRWPS
ncbi:MAG: phosphoglycolate phosphatase [Hyphomicrobium sp.]|nr:phosphoglycolate phosphatase [Hyphomicrobium sp.]